MEVRARESTYLVSPLPPLSFPSALVSGAHTDHGGCDGNGHGAVGSLLSTAFLLDLVVLLVNLYLSVVLFLLACLILFWSDFRVRVWSYPLHCGGGSLDCLSVGWLQEGMGLFLIEVQVDNFP